MLKVTLSLRRAKKEYRRRTAVIDKNKLPATRMTVLLKADIEPKEDDSRRYRRTWIARGKRAKKIPYKSV